MLTICSRWTIFYLSNIIFSLFPHIAKLRYHNNVMVTCNVNHGPTRSTGWYHLQLLLNTFCYHCRNICWQLLILCKHIAFISARFNLSKVWWWFCKSGESPAALQCHIDAYIKIALLPLDIQQLNSNWIWHSHSDPSCNIRGSVCVRHMI